MSILLLVVGAIAVVVGVGMAAFGIPINEFSFGNTLIVAGITAASGGLIVIGLGAAVGQLHRIAEALAARNAIAEAHAFEVPLEAPVAAAPPARIPFPPKPKAEPAVNEPVEPPPVEPEQAVPSEAPSLRNPEGPPLALEDEVSLSPKHPAPEPAPTEFMPPRSPPPREETPASNFDAMWPAEPETPRAPLAEAEPAPSAAEPPPAPETKPETSEPPAEREVRNVAILKSGVVDGMAYTLYVDGSIEAELPNGTLHFASIEELRGHLEKNAS